MALSTGERTDLLSGVSKINSHLEQLLFRDVLHLLHVQATQGTPTFGDLVAEEEVPPHRHQGDGRQVLVHGRNTFGECITRRVKAHRLTLHLVHTAGRLVNTGEGFDQRGFSRTVVAEDAGDVRFAHLHRNIGKSDHTAEGLADAFQLQSHVRHRLAPFARLPIKVLVSTAASKITPMKVQRQS